MPPSRDSACAEVASDALLDARPQGRICVVDEPTGRVGDALVSVGVEVVPWFTRAWEECPARARPPEGVWDGALIRLPRERARLELLLHLVGDRLQAGAALWVVGANDEGIKSTARHLEPLFEEVETVIARKHCRLLRARRSVIPARGTLEAWETRRCLVLPGAEEPVEVVVLPGVFARGDLDPATALLLDAVAGMPIEGPCLDFAAGIGVIALGVSRQLPGLSWTLTDVDAWSLHCARQNLPEAEVGLGSGWTAVPSLAAYGTIFSNPPLHRGVSQDRTILDRLIDQAPGRLRKGGQLILVSQRTAGVGSRLRRVFSSVRLLREDGRFQVWAGL